MATAVREITCKTILTRTGGFLEGYTHTLQPYVGCVYRCPYCYVQALPVHLYHGGAWGDYVDVKINAPARLEAEMARLKKRGKPVRVFLSSATDPYQGAESKYRITRQCLEVFAGLQPDRLVVQTRSPMVRRDFDVLKRIEEVELNLTLETHDETVRRNLTPHAPTVASRLKTLDAAMETGLPVRVTISPMLPNDPDAFVETLRDRCHSVVVDTYFDGDGSGGMRTERLQVREMYERFGYGEWYRLGAHHALVDALAASFGAERVAYSKEGFNRAVRIVRAARAARPATGPREMAPGPYCDGQARAFWLSSDVPFQPRSDPAGNLSRPPENMPKVTVAELQDFIDGVPFVHDLGLRIVEVEDGICRGRLPYQSRFAQSYNLVHGGVTASLADTMAYMAHATLNGITRDTVTTNLTVTYLYAASEEALNAEARVIKNGRKVLYGEVVITNDAGTRVAHATVTYLRLDYEPRG